MPSPPPPAPPSTRTFLWSAIVRMADPDYDAKARKEPAYEWSNGRVHVNKINPYSTP